MAKSFKTTTKSDLTRFKNYLNDFDEGFWIAYGVDGRDGDTLSVMYPCGSAAVLSMRLEGRKYRAVDAFRLDVQDLSSAGMIGLFGKMWDMRYP